MCVCVFIYMLALFCYLILAEIRSCYEKIHDDDDDDEEDVDDVMLLLTNINNLPGLSECYNHNYRPWPHIAG